MVCVELSDKERLKKDAKLVDTSLEKLTDFVQGRRRESDFLRDVGNKVGVFAVTHLGKGNGLGDTLS